MYSTVKFLLILEVFVKSYLLQVLADIIGEHSVYFIFQRFLEMIIEEAGARGQLCCTVAP